MNTYRATVTHVGELAGLPGTWQVLFAVPELASQYAAQTPPVSMHVGYAQARAFMRMMLNGETITITVPVPDPL